MTVPRKDPRLSARICNFVAHHRISRMPGGYDSVSIGQIRVARQIYPGPTILQLVSATRGIDNVH
jgi:hypothetical protein